MTTIRPAGPADIAAWAELRAALWPEGPVAEHRAELPGDPAHRRAGVGRALVASFEARARERGCEELASDTWPENDVSLRAHRRLGFEEVDRIVTLRKPLDADITAPASSRPPTRWRES